MIYSSLNRLRLIVRRLSVVGSIESGGVPGAPVPVASTTGCCDRGPLWVRCGGTGPSALRQVRLNKRT